MDCNVVRDLLPLVQDDVASEESKRAVSEHLAECPACTDYLRDMQSALQTKKSRMEQEKQDFDKTAHQLRAKRRRRVWRNVLIGVVVGVLLVIGAGYGWSKLTQEFNTPVYFGEYNVFLSRLTDGRTVVNFDYKGSYSWSVVDWEEQIEDGQSILYISLKRPFIRHLLEQPNTNYACGVLNSLDGYAEIRAGLSSEYSVVWRKGDAIPAASVEMNAYYVIENQIESIVLRETSDGKAVALTFQDQQRLNELYDAEMTARDAVPEWQ